MKASTRFALPLLGVLAALVTAPSATAGAQMTTRQPPADAPRMLITTLHGPERAVGMQAADAIRSRIGQDFPFRELWVIPKNDVNATLEASGYERDIPLSPLDARQLASSLRADEYLLGTATRENGVFKVNARLVLGRDNALVQPLPPAQGARLDLVALQIVRDLKEARKQLSHERQCANLAREGKYPEAAAAARAGIAAYGNATLARLCLASVMAAMKAPTDSVIAVTNEVLRVDPTNRLALAIVADAYKSAGNVDKAIDSWVTMLANDPKNVRLQTQVVNEIAAAGRAASAVPIIDQAVKDNPGDPDLLRLQYLILLTTKEWKRAITAGEELLRADTSYADTLFFTRLVAAYQGDSQPAKASEAAARGAAKFPQNAGLKVLHAQMLRGEGNLQAAAAAASQALAIDPKVPRGYLMLASIYNDLGQPDSVLTALQRAISSGGDSASFVAQYALSVGNNLYKAANAIRDDEVKKRTAFQQAIRVLAFSDTTSPTDEAKFLIGVSSFSVGQSAATEAGRTKNCELSRLAQGMFATAQINIPRGGRFAPQAAAQYMGYLGQFMPVVEQQVRSFCRG